MTSIHPSIPESRGRDRRIRSSRSSSVTHQFAASWGYLRLHVKNQPTNNKAAGSLGLPGGHKDLQAPINRRPALFVFTAHRLENKAVHSEGRKQEEEMGRKTRNPFIHYSFTEPGPCTNRVDR